MKNLIKNHILSLFQYKQYVLSKQEKKELNKIGLEKFILNKLTSAKYRRQKISEEEKKNILRKIENFVKNNKPIKITPCFGGYKQFWAETYPGVGFAEVFHIYHMLKYISPIVEVYTPGVVIEWESEDVALEIADNYSKESLDIYSNQFLLLLKEFQKNIPENLKLKYVRSREQYDENILKEKMQALKEEKVKIIECLDEEEKELSIKRAERNFLWKGDEDFSGLDKEEKMEKVIESKVLNLAFLDADYELREKYFEEEVIPVVFSFGIDKENVGGWLTISSTSASFCDFWAGNGVLEVRENGKIIERILTKQQYLELKDKLLFIDIDFNIKGLNLEQKIPVYQGSLKF